MGVSDESKQVLRRVGHDLRNKLAILQNSVYYLNMKLDPAEAKVRKHLDILAREVALGNLLTMNVMDLLAAKAPEPASIDGLDLLRRAIERAPAPDGVDIRLESAGDAPVWADVDQMIHALTNILTYQYSTLDSGGTVRLVAHGTGPVSLDLVDSGPGLTREEQAVLLDWQAAEDAAVVRMGLAVADHLALVNGGRLQFESRPRLGTRFSLILPAQAAPA